MTAITIAVSVILPAQMDSGSREPRVLAASPGVVEKMAFNTSHLASLLKYRLTGFAADAFAFNAHDTIDSLTQLTPGRLLSTPGLWIGLVFAAAFLAAAVRLRRYRKPL